MISSQTRQTVLGIDEAISISDSDFSQSGLKNDSIIRLTRLAVVSDSIFLGTTGEISAARLEKLKNNLAHWIKTSWDTFPDSLVYSQKRTEQIKKLSVYFQL